MGFSSKRQTVKRHSVSHKGCTAIPVKARRSQTTDSNILSLAQNYAPLRHNKPNRASASSKNALQNLEGLQKGVEKVHQNVPKARLSGPCFRSNLLSFNHLHEECNMPPPFRARRISMAICSFPRSGANSSIQIDTVRGPENIGVLKTRGLSSQTNAGHLIDIPKIHLARSMPAYASPETQRLLRESRQFPGISHLLPSLRRLPRRATACSARP